MANFKRKRRKYYTISTCGSRSCVQDRGRYHGDNGRNRYLPQHWKKFDGRQVWRYIHKNVDTY